MYYTATQRQNHVTPGETLQLHCRNLNAKVAVYAALHGVHSPPIYRVNVVMGNFDEFSRAFNCSLGSPMNPLRKCAVW